MTTTSTQQSILESVKKDNWFTFYENNAGGYKKEALQSVIRNLADELGRYDEAEKFLSRSRSYNDLRKFYETELEGTVIDLPF